MKYTVEKLLNEQEFSEMECICGEEGMRKDVSGSRIIEVIDMARHLMGGEILITSLYTYRTCSTQKFRKCLNQFTEKKISGFFVKEREELEIEEKEKKLYILQQYCKKEKIPLIRIPKHISFWEIITFVMNKIYTEEVARLKYFKLTHDNFNTITFTNEGSNNKFKEVLKLLSHMLQNPVALYFGTRNYCYATDGEECKLEFLENLEAYTPDIITKFRYMKQKGDYVEHIVKIDVLNQVEAYLVIKEKNREIVFLDYMAIENAIITLQHGFVTYFAQNEIEKKYHHDIVQTILNGSVEKKDLEMAANILGIQKEQEYQVVLFQTLQEKEGERYTKEQLHEVGVIEGEIMTLKPDEFIIRNMDYIVMIEKVNAKLGQAYYQKEMEDLKKILEKSTRYRKKNVKIRIGIGKMVKGIYDISESYREARKALSYIDIIRLTAADKEKSVARYADLGFFKLLGDVKDPNELKEYIPESLKRLIRYEKKKKKDLLLTLQVYLDHNQSLKQTADQLFVHYKTASYRMEKIEKITGMDFKNANEMLSVRNGLIIYKMMEVMS